MINSAKIHTHNNTDDNTHDNTPNKARLWKEFTRLNNIQNQTEEDKKNINDKINEINEINEIKSKNENNILNKPASFNPKIKKGGKTKKNKRGGKTKKNKKAFIKNNEKI